MISSRQPSTRTERVAASAGLLHGASAACLITSLIGGTALLLEVVWPWLAWGYAGVALVFGLALRVIASRVSGGLEREAERVRRQRRSD